MVTQNVVPHSAEGQFRVNHYPIDRGNLFLRRVFCGVDRSRVNLCAPKKRLSNHGGMSVALLTIVTVGVIFAMYFTHPGFHGFVNHILHSKITVQKALLLMTLPIVTTSAVIALTIYFNKKHRESVEENTCGFLPFPRTLSMTSPKQIASTLKKNWKVVAAVGFCTTALAIIVTTGCLTHHFWSTAEHLLDKGLTYQMVGYRSILCFGVGALVVSAGIPLAINLIKHFNHQRQRRLSIDDFTRLCDEEDTEEDSSSISTGEIVVKCGTLCGEES